MKEPDDVLTYNSVCEGTRWITGEICGVMRGVKHVGKSKHTGKGSAKLSSTGVHIGKISLDDPRWETGEIVGIKKKLNV